MKRISLLLAVIVSGCSGLSSNKELTDADRARIHVDIANGALVQGDPTSALKQLLMAEKIDNTLPELHHSKALAYLAKRDTGLALKSARQAVLLSPGYSDANTTLGKILIDQKKYKEAEPYLLRAAESHTYYRAHRPRTLLGVIQYRTGKYNTAVRHFNKAIEQSPNEACIAYYYRGHVRMRDNKIDDAIADYIRAGKKLCGSFAQAQFALAEAYARNKEYDRARKQYIQVRRVFPDSPLAEKALSRLRDLPIVEASVD